MATNNMHNLTTLIKRLEAATARLEDIASSTVELPQAVPALQQTLATPTTASSSASAPGPPPAPQPTAPQQPPEPLPESIEDFDAFVAGPVAKYVKISGEIGGLISDQAQKVLEGFREQRNFLLITTKAKKPDMTGSEMSVYQNLLKPINEALMAVTTIKDSNRGSPFFTQLSAVAEGIMVLAWVTVEGRPYKHVEESLGSVQFFGNRVLKENKDTNPQNVEWIQAYYQIFRDLTEYVKRFPQGLPWNPKGQPAEEVAKAVKAGSGAPPAPAPAAGSAPPPPPPPPGPPPVLKINEVKEDTGAGSGGGGFNAVFSELNKGENVTKGLRKVDRSEMTHKNPSLRASSTVPESDSSVRGKSPAPGKKPKPESMRVKKPSKKELDGNKWTIENFDKETQPIEIHAERAHSVLISRCSNVVIIIKGKANAVTIENTNRLSLVVDSLVSAVDVVKSQNFALQVLGSIPTILLDQIDGATIYLSKESTTTRVFHSKTSGVNLNVLEGGDGGDEDDGDFKEVPLPSQMCSYYDPAKGELVDEIVSHAG